MEEIKNVLINIFVKNEVIISTALALTIAVLIVKAINKFIAISNENKKRKETKLKRDEISRANKSLQGVKFKYFNYYYLDKYITETGLKYMFGSWLNPASYIVLKIVSGILLMLVGISLGGLVVGIPLFFAGFFFLEFIAHSSNKSDNNKMLEDIKAIYDIMRIQSKAGVHIVYIITDCYLTVSHKRLKRALLELTSDLAVKSDMEYAMETFRGKFRNDYIDTLSVIIKQSMKTGKASKMFDDIREQIESIEKALVENEKEKIKRAIITVQMMVYLSVISAAIFIAVKALQQGVIF